MRSRRHTAILLILTLLPSCGIQRFSLRTVPMPQDTTLYGSIRPAFRPLSAMLTEDTGLPPREGNGLTLYADGAERLKATLQDWNDVQVSLCVEKYRLAREPLTDTLFRLMEKKAKDGVDVRLLVERHAQLPPHRVHYRNLRRSGVDVREVHPPGHFVSNLMELNRRNHRKLEIMDGRVAYVGGRNLADRNFSTWQDLDVRLTGPVVGDLTEVFMKQWTGAGGREERPGKLDGDASAGDKTVQALFDGPKDRLWTIRDLYEWTLTHTESYFYCSTPYFAPPFSTVEALCDAARRGVDVRLLLPEDCDLRMMNRVAESYFRRLLAAGVRIWLSPVMNHAKHFIADGYLSCIGSANLDQRSFFTNYEDDVVVYDEDTASEGRRIYLDQLAGSREVTWEEVRGWSVLRRMAGGFVRIFSRQL